MINYKSALHIFSGSSKIGSLLPEKQTLRFLLVTTMVASIGMLDAASPLAFKKVVNQIVLHHRSEGELWMMIYLSFRLGKRLLQALSRAAFSPMSRAIRSHFTTAAYDLVLHLDPDDFHKWGKSDIRKTVGDALKGVRSLYGALLFSLLPSFFQLMTMCIVLIVTGVDRFIVYTLLCFSVVFLTSFRIGYKRQLTLQQIAEKSDSDTYVSQHATLTNYEVISHFRAYDYAVQRILRFMEASETKWHKLGLSRLANAGILGFLALLTFSLMIIYGFREYLTGDMSIGQFVLINTYAAQILSPVELIARSSADVASHVSKSLLMTKYIDALAAKTRRIDYIDDPELLVRLESIGYTKNGRIIVSDINIDIRSGEFIGLIGETGSGKSTLLKLLAGHLQPTEGRVFHSNYALQSRASMDMCCLMPQDTTLFDDTIRNNILLGKNMSSERLMSVVDACLLGSVIKSLPDGLETKIGERGAIISGGERQRIGMARALLDDAPIILMDEPSSALDDKTRSEIIDNLLKERKGRTLVIVTHSPQVLRSADRVIKVEKGLIAQCDTSVIEGPARGLEPVR